VGRLKGCIQCEEHGVSFDEAAPVFSDPLALVVADPLHPEREILIGISVKQRVLFIVFVELSGDTIRIISARRATSHERRHYEEEDDA
jgi:uncharacterized DUF497 family protein